MKTQKILFIVMVIIILTVSCAGSPKTEQKTASSQTTSLNVPAWINEIPPEDVIWGIGFINLQNSSLAMQTATQIAQRDIADQISVLVQGSLTNYASESGLANSSRSIQSIENITRSLTNMNLSGAVPNQRIRTDDGTWWVRVAYKKADAQRAASQFVNNEMADYAEFRADQALKRLEYDLEKSQSKPVPRTQE